MSTQFTRSESGTLSYIGRINYVYAEKYLFEFLLRSDVSPSSLLKIIGSVPCCKCRVGLCPKNLGSRIMLNGWTFEAPHPSVSPVDNTAAWQWMQVYAQDANRGIVFGEGTGNDSSNRITINKNNSAVNRDVHWDKDYKFNFGIDASVLDRRLDC